MSDKPTDKKKSIWEHIKSTNGKIAIVIAFFVGYQELRPIVKDLLGVDDDIQAVITECNAYTDAEIMGKEERAEMYLDILTDDIYRIQKKMERDSIEYANNHKKFAVGFRSDHNGILSYRDKFGNECATRINHTTGQLEFFNLRKDRWDRCFYENQ